MICAIYTRVSTEKEIQESSMAHQEKFFKEYAKKNDWIIYKVYKDKESAFKMKSRHGLNSLIDDANKKKFQIVLTKSISRFARNTLEGLTIIRQFKEKNIRFMTIEDNFDSNKYDEFTFTILLSLAQKESEKMSERIIFGKRCRAKEGHFNGSIIPYGYKKISKNSIVPKNNISTLVVKKIFSMYIKGHGLRAIANELNEKKYPTPSQERGYIDKNIWYESTIKNILTNEFYIGNLLQNKKTASIYMKNTHKAIIDEHIFYEVQKNINKKNRRSKSSGLYGSILICASCGSKMYYRKKEGYYLCSNYVKNGKNKCLGNKIYEKNLTCEIIEKINHHRKENKITSKLKEHKNMKKHIKKEISLLKCKHNKLLELLIEKIIEPNVFKEKSLFILNEISLLKEEERLLNKDELVCENNSIPLKEYINTYIKKVVAGNGNIEIEYR